MIALLAPILLGASLPSSPDLGKAEGRCRPGEQGPSVLVEVDGLRDRQGLLKLELYPSNDSDFLQDDNVLMAAGKTFRRVEVEIPRDGRVELCIRAPTAGTFAISLLHDRDRNHRFGLSTDGIGFAGNPRLGWSKPRASAASVRVGPGPTRTRIVLNYRRGLSFRPIGR